MAPRARAVTALLLGACFFASAAPAAAGTADERAALERRKAALADRLTRLDTVAAVHGRLVALRDGELFGDKGFVPAVTQFGDDVTTWLQAWKDTVTILDKVSDLASSDVRAGLTQRVVDHGQKLSAIESTAYGLVLRAADVRARVGAIPTLGRQTLAEFGDNTEALDGEVKRLAALVEEATRLGEAGVLQNLVAIQGDAERLVRLRVGRALAGSPELDAALRDVEALFAAVRLTAPLVADVSAKTAELLKATADRRPFAAEVLKDKALRAADDALAAIEKSGLNSRYTANARDFITNRKTAAISAFSFEVAAFTKAELIAARHKRTGVLIAARCRDAARRDSVNCDLFRQVYRVPPERIATMNDAELRFMEEMMDKVALPAATSLPKR